RVRGIDSNPGFGLTAGRNDEILTRWNLEKILTNRVRGIDSNPSIRRRWLVLTPLNQLDLIMIKSTKTKVFS
ncbi:hypothetical protein ACFC8C_14830, partial [Enterococcus faecalis]|uniref:hypothetical protein n=1 Tax=Enterococcus faecalis TaxID=1351 RepID=UPI0035E237A6